MANSRQAFLIMASQEEIIEDLTDEELGKIFRSIFKYERTKEVPKFNDRYLNSVFKSFKTQLDFSEENYNKICEKNKQNINKRWSKNNTTVYEGIPPYTSVYEPNTSYTKNTNIIKDNIREDNIREEKIIKDNNVADATPLPIFNFPSILSYGEEKGADETYCKKFFNYYENKKWKKEEEWKIKFDEWVEKDGIQKNIKLKKVDDGVFTI